MLAGTNSSLQTTVQTYQDKNITIFRQQFPDTLMGTSIGDENMPLSHFPSLMQSNPMLGFLHYHGYMGGWYWQAGPWPRSYNGGIQGGPIIWFDEEMQSTLVFSSLNNFPVGIHNMVKRNLLFPEGDVFAVGLEGMIEEIPAGFQYSTILYSSENGLNSALMEWGDIMLNHYHKERPSPDSEISAMVDYLGYSTTGYYFYNPLQGDPNYGNYQETIMGVHNYSKQMKIPYGYYLIDSFWYGEHIYNNAVYLWQDDDEFLAQRFPNGLQWLRDQLGVPIVAHLGKWSSTTPYANYSSFDFISEAELAIPQSVEFWDFLMRNATSWGLTTVKQDHMNEQVLDMTHTLTNVHTIENWLTQEGQGCTNNRITIMYCMDFPNLFMNSLLVGAAATTSRASDDYVPDDADKNWKIGVTSALLWSIGLYPYKDTFYSNTTEEVIKPDAKFYGYTEPYPITHAVVSALSAGPVAPSDGIGSANISLIMKVCRQDGLLLKPDRPSVAIDRTWLQHAFGTEQRAELGPKGEVWTTYTTLGTNRWNYVIGVNLLETFKVVPSDLLSEGNFNPSREVMIAYAYDKNSLGLLPSQLMLFTSSGSLVIPKGENYGDFLLWVICPEIVPDGPVLLGELDKIVPVSRKRFQSVQVTAKDIIVVIRGVPNEVVQFSILPSSKDLAVVVQYSCTIPSNGISTFQYSFGGCY